MGNQGNIFERTQCTFNKPLSSDEVINQYLPYLERHVPESRILYSFEGRGEVIPGGGFERITKINATIRSKLSLIPMELRESFSSGDFDVGSHFERYNIFTTPGYEVGELPSEEIALIDKIKDLTLKFSKE